MVQTQTVIVRDVEHSVLWDINLKATMLDRLGYINTEGHV